jgi:hypothetical protein
MIIISGNPMGSLLDDDPIKFFGGPGEACDTALLPGRSVPSRLVRALSAPIRVLQEGRARPRQPHPVHILPLRLQGRRGRISGDEPVGGGEDAHVQDGLHRTLLGRGRPDRRGLRSPPVEDSESSYAVGVKTENMRAALAERTQVITDRLSAPASRWATYVNFLLE